MSTWVQIALFTVIAGVGMLPMVMDRSTSSKTVGTSVTCFVLAFFASLLVIALPKTLE
ncbi:hypothetical protein [Mumia zhuanghuii]|uniref:hypothetical protein n=1 Tax=Mumia zhuanghuii TaxID=2585211 RepID=UPI00129C6E3A|nr:hypothetical protein [Mumia zhuanghuii]